VGCIKMPYKFKCNGNSLCFCLNNGINELSNQWKKVKQKKLISFFPA